MKLFNKKKNILVVDDEVDILHHLSRILKRAGYGVLVTQFGRDVLDLAIKNKPDLIILDVLLPDISGPEVAVRISEKEDLKNIPIIFLTGMLSKEEEEKTHGIIANRTVISKPCDRDTLLKAIHNKINP